MSSIPTTVAALSANGLRVNRYDRSTKQWSRIGDATSTLHGGGFTLLGINPANADVSTWMKRNNWIKVGGPGSKFVVTSASVFGLSPARDGVYKWSADSTNWSEVGGPATNILGGGFNALFGISPSGGDIYG